MSRVVVSSIAVAIALTLAACGGGGDSALSRAKIDVKANALCVKAASDAKAFPVPADFKKNPAAAAAYLDKVVPLAQRLLADLKELKPASDVKADWNDFLAKEDTHLQVLDGVRQKAHARDKSGIADLEKDKTGPPANAAAAKAGLTSCGASS